MRADRLTPKRYQLKKEAVRALRRKHPWIFRGQISSAATPFRSGQWLRLIDENNVVVGYGIYDRESVVGIRVFKHGGSAPSSMWLDERLFNALDRRKPLLEETDAVRLVHGENDGFPGIVIERYGDIGVLQTYSPGVDTLGRYLATRATRSLGLRGMLWRMPVKRAQARSAEGRILFGTVPSVVSFHESELSFKAPLDWGQKGGGFLDLRGLRRWIRRQSWQGKRVLNCFAYTGMLGLAARAAGAESIRHVEISERAIAFGREHHGGPGIEWVQADVFDWMASSPPDEHDVVIVDPPQLASATKQTEKALAAYSFLHEQAAKRVAPGGILISACCTSRIPRDRFTERARRDLARRFTLIKDIRPELDHPVGFSEGDYLKILVFQRATSN